MSATFDETPICEMCGKGPAISFSYFEGQPQGKRWMFCCMCTSTKEDYFINIDAFFASPGATVDWLAHLHEKAWVNWGEFMDMMHRFRSATKSFNKL